MTENNIIILIAAIFFFIVGTYFNYQFNKVGKEEISKKL